MAKLDAVVEPASALAVNGSFLAVLLVGGLRVAEGSSSVGEVLAFLLYLTYLSEPTAAVFQAVSAMQQGTGALHRINEVLALPREPDLGRADPIEPVPASSSWERPADDAVPVLEFSGVWFAYDRQRPALRGVSFQMPRHGHITLIGRSGAGKSTIFALAERFYEPGRGRIRFEGEDVRTMSRTEYRDRIGFVEQECPVLYGTLRENLAHIAPDAEEEDIRRVIELANLSELVSRLPRGLDSDAGEHGTRLSSGERQRLTIARSLLTRPSLLLLDEPTSHLDPVNEAALGRTIARVAGECAMLVIAHRYSTVRAADSVVVLDHGKVVAVGNHEYLLDTNEYYRRLAVGKLRSRAALRDLRGLAGAAASPAPRLGGADRVGRGGRRGEPPAAARGAGSRLSSGRRGRRCRGAGRLHGGGRAARRLQRGGLGGAAARGARAMPVLRSVRSHARRPAPRAQRIPDRGRRRGHRQHGHRHTRSRLPAGTAVAVAIGTAVGLLIAFGDEIAQLLLPPAMPADSPRTDFRATTTEGESVSREIFAGRTLVAFVSTSCGVCKEQLPDLRAFASRMPGGRRRVLAVVVGGAEDAVQYVEALASVALVVIEPRGGPVTTAFAVRGFPAYGLVESLDGAVVASAYAPTKLPAPAAT